ncbi:epithelial splicing regulatory protein 1 [Caerostris extrusa]|uniref:Epithelial splicing regulatory protein 1 n=1 Tax=Caerostris extrusa TaxID=172846 RepID=A0AAV4WXU4_CAEEX|nr:epithelial splicing regulatory protein 1 [Caerostris extrusa]
MGQKVVAAQTHMVKPRGCDVNENALSDACKTELGLSEEQVKTGQPLEQVVEQRDTSLALESAVLVDRPEPVCAVADYTKGV